MRRYETVVIVDPELSEEKRIPLFDRFAELISGDGGLLVKNDEWGPKKLAYEINKQERGVYVLLIFKAPPATIKVLEDLYKVYDPVFKYMFVRLEKKQREHVLRTIEAAASPAAEKTEEATE